MHLRDPHAATSRIASKVTIGCSRFVDRRRRAVRRRARRRATAAGRRSSRPRPGRLRGRAAAAGGRGRRRAARAALSAAPVEFQCSAYGALAVAAHRRAVDVERRSASTGSLGTHVDASRRRARRPRGRRCPSTRERDRRVVHAHRVSPAASGSRGGRGSSDREQVPAVRRRCACPSRAPPRKANGSTRSVSEQPAVDEELDAVDAAAPALRRVDPRPPERRRPCRRAPGTTTDVRGFGSRLGGSAAAAATAGMSGSRLT